MLKWISAAWKTALQTGFPPTDRFYLDFRLKEYPHIAGTPTYTAIVSGTNKAGYSNMTGDYAEYLLDMPTKLVLDVECVPAFAYDVATPQDIAGWYVSANTYLTIYYNAASDMIYATWKGNGTAGSLTSEQYDDGTSHTNINTVRRVTLVLDTTTGDTSGSALYVNGVLQDAVWSAAIDARDIHLPLFQIRALAGDVGAWTINSVRLIPNTTATATEVADHFKTVEYEEIVWPLNSCALGRTRCNVTSFVLDASSARQVEDLDTGSLVSNQLSLRLKSPAGQFADDQYAAFAPVDNVYNGTSAQAYMRQRCGAMAETWYGDDFEPYFVGHVEGGFQRSTPIGDVSTVAVSCLDATAELAKRQVRRSRYWEDLYIGSSTEASSLVHLITRLGTKREVYNFVANSSFENATIANSWAASGGVLTRVADPLVGSNCGQLANATGAEKEVAQTVTFLATKKLNVGETWTWAIYLKAAAAAAADIRIDELDAGGVNDTTDAAYSLAGGEGYVKYEVSHTVTDSDSDRLKAVVEVADGTTVLFDCAMLTQSTRAFDWFVLNDNDGAAGVESADDADYSSYDTCGFNVDDVSIQHPWARADRGQNVWDIIKQLSDATMGYRVGFAECGVFEFKAILADGYADPTPIETISTAGGITATLNPLRANKIRILGTWVQKDTYERLVWAASATKAFQIDKSGTINQAVANGATWPPSTEYGEFVAKYDVGATLIQRYEGELI